ncbi:MAG TPA: serine/threonine-protein kinase, partial [Gammaproteobacteria bacterium]|nr:serine/threonine-protein kinase [Gammaproteobacteria bacterium]
ADRYPIIKLLGSGAMGSVYLAEDLRLKREIALKMLAPGLSVDEHLLARFRQEALALARLSHPNIVQVYDFFEENGFFWIAMEFVKGGELDARLKASGRLTLAETLTLTKQMADALGYAHEQGVVHRDFKPANVLLTPGGHVKITDFGIAKLAQSSLHTQLNTVLGTPSYMSPEQANGETTDHRTDIYSLGIVFYQMLAGEPPFKGDARSIIAQHFLKEVPRLNELRQDISPAIDQIIQKMLAKKPADRYQSMSELIDELGRVSIQV